MEIYASGEADADAERRTHLIAGVPVEKTRRGSAPMQRGPLAHRIVRAGTSRAVVSADSQTTHGPDMPTERGVQHSTGTVRGEPGPETRISPRTCQTVQTDQTGQTCEAAWERCL